MEEREKNPHERLKQKLSELEQEWIAMKTSKSSSAIPLITVEDAIRFVENSPRELMLSLQQEQASQLAEILQIRSPFRRKLFHDSDDYSDEIKTASSCLSSNVTRVRDNNCHQSKKSGRIVTVISMVILLLLVLVVLMNGFDHLSMNTQIDTLVPT